MGVVRYTRLEVVVTWVLAAVMLALLLVELTTSNSDWVAFALLGAVLLNCAVSYGVIWRNRRDAQRASEAVRQSATGNDER